MAQVRLSARRTFLSAGNSGHFYLRLTEVVFKRVSFGENEAGGMVAMAPEFRHATGLLTALARPSVFFWGLAALLLRVERQF